jgi:hypothetical protein
METITPPQTPTTSHPLQSTPVKVDTATVLPFTTTQKYRVESYTAFAEEIRRYIVGPMPVDRFLDDFLPLTEVRNTRLGSSFAAGCYNETVGVKYEVEAYNPFVSLSRGFLVHPNSCNWFQD